MESLYTNYVYLIFDMIYHDHAREAVKYLSRIGYNICSSLE